MKRFLLACGLCMGMLIAAFALFMPAGRAKSRNDVALPSRQDVLEGLLALPAPPPPNPLESASARDDAFYDPKNPPPDNAPIQDLIDYWSHQSDNYRGVLFYSTHPSQKVLQRLVAEGGMSTIGDIVNILPDDRTTGDLVKQMFDDPSTPKEMKGRLRNWLTLNSAYFIEDTTRSAQALKDVNNYVSVPDQSALLALTRHDWESARVIVDRLYNDPNQPVSKALATWALYRHAMESGDLGDTDRYRSELMKMVENRQLSNGVRDMANDAIVREPDFPGRDEWCWSLFEDETLVKMPQFTGLTTLMMYAPPDKYVPKMIEFLKSSNKLVRTAAARNLVTVMGRDKNPEIVTALLPWIGDAAWLDLTEDNASRSQLVMQLQSIKIPESVPYLISALDEKATREIEDYGPAVSANTAVNNVMTNTARLSAVNSNAASPKLKTETYFPLREYAVRALQMQADARAVPSLKRILSATTGYQRNEIIATLLACGGYSPAEQVDALERLARSAATLSDQATYSANSANSNRSPGSISGSSYGYVPDENDMLGVLVLSQREPSEPLIHAAIERVQKLEGKDPAVSRTLRLMIRNWKGLTIDALLLSDLQEGKADSSAVIRLLAERKILQEKLPQEIGDLNNGDPVGAGIVSCLSEDSGALSTALASKSVETRTAVLACARLIRAQLPLSKVAEDLNASDKLLRSAAELYLESEDSHEARSMVLALHPGEAKILGATVYFRGRAEDPSFTPDLMSLFASVGGPSPAIPNTYPAPISNDIEKSESLLQKVIKADAELVGIYSYKENSVRIYKDRISYRWQDDPSRYHERELQPQEFDSLKQYFLAHHVSELKPFLSCAGGCGNPRELIMLGRNGGSRVFVNSERTPAFFAGLEKMFSDFRASPSSIRYALGKEIPGMELLFASDDIEAQTVWKQGNDLRVVVANRAVREKVEEEISQIEESQSGDDEPDEDSALPTPAETSERVAPSEKMRVQRQYEGYAWHKFDNGLLGEAAPQPAGVEYIPARDGLTIEPDQEQWKARGPGFEIRADDTGLYKVAGGKLIKLKTGSYTDPILSQNGRWIVVNKFVEDEGPSLVRYDLTTHREFKIDFEAYGNLLPRCYVPAVGKFLIASGYFEEGYYESDDDQKETDDENIEPETPQTRFYLLDAATGIVTPANGELRPLASQSFRPLQATGRASEFWAAISNRGRNETVVGTYDSRSFRFKPVIKLPKIAFSSMDMWVDDGEAHVYFVYNGHLLSVPYSPQRPAAVVRR